VLLAFRVPRVSDPAGTFLETVLRGIMHDEGLGASFLLLAASGEIAPGLAGGRRGTDPKPGPRSFRCTAAAAAASFAPSATALTIPSQRELSSASATALGTISKEHVRCAVQFTNSHTK
jgi:hypothetical protein